MWLKIFVLISFVASISFAQDATISCNYVNRGSTYPYTCNLQVNNPSGSDDFQAIPGTHLDGFSDADVQFVQAFSQNSLNVPSVICRQFTNLRNVELLMTNIGVISESAFEDCENLEQLALVYNNIEEIPENTFRNNQNLQYIFLGHNQVSRLHPTSFTGSVPIYINLEFNFLGQFDPLVFESINETLTTLNVMANEISQLPSLGFANLRNVQWIDFTANELTELPPSDAFEGLVSLTHLYVIACNLHTLNANWFNPMTSLVELHVEMNDISELTNDVFNGLRRLDGLFLGYNQLTEMTSAPFGRILVNLEVLSLLRNQIFAISDEFFLRAENLDALELYDNVCSLENHFNINNNRNAVRDRLRRCFDNFGSEIISCRFAPNTNGDYSCNLDIRNPLGNDFVEISGEHLADRENGDVVMISAFESNTIIIPPVLCRQFGNLHDVVLMSSYLAVLNEASFGSCVNLERLDLEYNIITTIADNSFVNNPNLRELYMGHNLINRISDTSFAGSAIEVLDLSNNNIFEFNSLWYESINETLRILDLMNNNIAILPSNAFANLRTVTDLVLNGNSLYSVQSDTFNSLVNLQTLGLSNTGLRELDQQWFTNLVNLRHLYIASNQLTDLPAGIFDSLTNLQDIYVYSNRLVDLRADSFGRSLSSLTLIYATSNVINVVDSELVSGASSLQYLLLYGNLCTQTNFYGVSENVGPVLEGLNFCVGNFEAENQILCDYQRLISGNIYYCELTVTNPSGRTLFDTIDGNHLGTSTDDHVTFVSIFRQNTFNIPTVLCSQFPGLNRIDIVSSFTFELTTETFTDCQTLNFLSLIDNNLTSVPALAFSRARNLATLFLSSNNIVDVSPSAFYNTQISELDLSNNQISHFDPMTYATVSDTLRVLRLNRNLIMELPENSFTLLINLDELDLSHNRLYSIPSEVFASLENLRFLHMSDCGIERLDERWFANLNSLVDLQLSSNEIRHLPENIFNLPLIRDVIISNNNLRVLDASAFGSSISSLLHLSAENNRINSFDPNLFDGAENLFGLDLTGNLCIDVDFLDIPLFRESIRGYFGDCFETFESAAMSCTFSEDEAHYECELIIENEAERLRFDTIDLEHLDGRNDNYVNYVRAVDQNTPTIPAIICQRFQYIEGISWLASNVQFISLETFRNCEFLFSINLAGNQIESLAEGIFSGNEYLSSLNLALNRISTLSPGVFVGTQIYYIDLGDNHITSFNPASLAPIRTSLMYLGLRHNQFNTLPRSAFTSFINLRFLDISANRLDGIPSNAFRSLTHLYSLEMANCALGTLNYRWFDDLVTLTSLEVDMNGLRELPDNIFDLPTLGNLGIAYNQLTVLNSTTFGASIGSLVMIRAENNEINAIDETIFDGASQLFSLTLTGNQCTDADFIEIQENMEAVRTHLQPCFDNFNQL